MNWRERSFWMVTGDVNALLNQLKIWTAPSIIHISLNISNLFFLLQQKILATVKMCRVGFHSNVKMWYFMSFVYISFASFAHLNWNTYFSGQDIHFFTLSLPLSLPFFLVINLRDCGKLFRPICIKFIHQLEILNWKLLKPNYLSILISFGIWYGKRDTAWKNHHVCNI